MPSSKSSKSIISWFKDGCDFNSKGKAVRGPGFFCWTYLVIMMIGIIISTSLMLYSAYTEIRQDDFNIKFIIYSIINILWAIAVMYFMYRMCYICRPWTGFGILIIAGIVYTMVQKILFKDLYDQLLNSDNNTFKKK